MSEEESQAQEQAKSEEKKEGGALSGNRVWIVVVVMELCTVALFLTLMKLQGGQGSQEGLETAQIKTDFEEYGAHTVVLEDLNYSIPMTSQNNKILAMSVVIVLGKTPREMQKNVELTAEDWTTYSTAVQKMEFRIKDMLIQYIGSLNYNQLRDQSGKQKIKDRVKEFVNEELNRLDFDDKLSSAELDRERVVDVLLPSYYMD